MKKLIAAVALTFLASSSAFAMDFVSRQFTYDLGTDSFMVNDANGKTASVIVVQELAATRLDPLKGALEGTVYTCLSKGVFTTIGDSRVFTLLAIAKCE